MLFPERKKKEKIEVAFPLWLQCLGLPCLVPGLEVSAEAAQ